MTLAVWPGAARSLSAQRGRDPRGRGGRGRPAPPSALLESITSLTCAFPASSVTTWQDGEPQVHVNSATAALTLAITSIDAQEGTAGSRTPDCTETRVKLAGSNLHVLDIRPDGALTVTTVFAQESREGRLKAVHSRIPDSSQVLRRLRVHTPLSAIGRPSRPVRFRRSGS